MNRRNFFARLAGAVAATAVAPQVCDSLGTVKTPAIAWSAGTSTAMNVGDVFTIQGRYLLNPPPMQRFIVTAVAESD